MPDGGQQPSPLALLPSTFKRLRAASRPPPAACRSSCLPLAGRSGRKLMLHEPAVKTARETRPGERPHRQAPLPVPVHGESGRIPPHHRHPAPPVRVSSRQTAPAGSLPRRGDCARVRPVAAAAGCVFRPHRRGTARAAFGAFSDGVGALWVAVIGWVISTARFPGRGRRDGGLVRGGRGCYRLGPMPAMITAVALLQVRPAPPWSARRHRPRASRPRPRWLP